MAIGITCLKCKAAFTTTDRAAGGGVPCPNCGAFVTAAVPVPPALPPRLPVDRIQQSGGAERSDDYPVRPPANPPELPRRRPAADAVNPRPRTSHGALIGVGIGIAAVVLLVGVFVIPWLTLIGGVAAVGLGVVWVIPQSRHRLASLLGLAPRSGAIQALRAGGLLGGGFCLMVCSVAVIAARDHSRAADQRFEQLLADGRTALAAGHLNEAGELADRAAGMPGREQNPEAAELRDQITRAKAQARMTIAKAESDRLFRRALAAIDDKEYKEAAGMLEQYVALPYAAEAEKARVLRHEVEVVISPAAAVALLEGLSEEDFAAWTGSGSLPAELKPKEKALADAYRSAVTAGTAEATRRRVELKKQREAERLARVEAERKAQQEREEQASRAAALAKERAAEEERRRKEAAAEATRKAEEAARKAEEEFDADGLVLLNKTVKGTANSIGIEITGTVVNRRKRELRYAQITFKLFDESGAQVGTALANIANLEPGGSWNFKAVGFNKAAKYKFAELVGR